MVPRRGGPVQAGRHIPVVVQGPAEPPIRHVLSLPPPPPIGTTDTGAAAVWDATPPDRTADTGAVDPSPWIPVILGRGRVVLGIPFSDAGDTARGLFVCSVCEGQFDSYTKLWLNGNLMPGDGLHSTWLADPNNVHWYVDVYPGDGSSSWSSKVPLKTCAHLVVLLYGDIWRPWQSVWVTRHSYLDAVVDFAA